MSRNTVYLLVKIFLAVINILSLQSSGKNIKLVLRNRFFLKIKLVALTTTYCKFGIFSQEK